MRFCDVGWFRSGCHHLRADDDNYKPWSVPRFADPSLYAYYSILYTKFPQKRHKSKKYSTNAKTPSCG